MNHSSKINASLSKLPETSFWVVYSDGDEAGEEGSDARGVRFPRLLLPPGNVGVSRTTYREAGSQPEVVASLVRTTANSHSHTHRWQRAGPIIVPGPVCIFRYILRGLRSHVQT